MGIVELNDNFLLLFQIQFGSRRSNVKQTKIAGKSPYILEDLEPDASYEVFVQARNFYGFGDPTTRIVFRTAKKRISTLIKAATDFDYDQQGCCSRAGKNRL